MISGIQVLQMQGRAAHEPGVNSEGIRRYQGSPIPPETLLAWRVEYRPNRPAAISPLAAEVLRQEENMAILV